MTSEAIKNNPIVRHTFEFALMINEYATKLRGLSHWDWARQMFRSGTSIGANVWEAQNGESVADFVHKMKIAAKESNETLYWLMLCEQSSNYPDCKSLLAKLDEVQRLLSSIIATTKKNNPLKSFIGHLLFLLKPATTLAVFDSFN
jgi:four helix bundle protein